MSKFIIHAAPTQLAVTTVVPVVAAFIVSRLLVLLTLHFSTKPTTTNIEPPILFKISGTVFILSIISAAAVLLCWGIYGGLHLSIAQSRMLGSLRFAGLLAIVGFVGMLISAMWRSLAILFGAVMSVLLASLLEIPRKLVDGLIRCLPRVEVLFHGR